VTVQVQAGGLVRMLGRLSKALGAEGVNKFIRALAFMGEAESKRRAPVDSGFLRASIRATQKRAGEWWITVGAAYAVFVEFGTRYARAQPFFTPMVKFLEKEAERLFALMMEREMEGRGNA
jgi:HK97 gp10 family phage protein